MHDIIFLNILSISVFLCRFASWERYCNYPLTITQADRFASCENTVSRSQTSSLPPPRWFNWIKPVLKTVSHVGTSKILEVSKEHAERKSRAAFRRGFSRGVNKPTTRHTTPQTRHTNDFHLKR